MRYHLSCPEPATHLFHLSLEVDQPGEALELALPVWTPGSYLVREFARHLEAVSAADGQAAAAAGGAARQAPLPGAQRRLRAR